MARRRSEPGPVAPDAAGLADARLRFLTTEGRPVARVRTPILASWTRSRSLGVRADAVRVPFEPDPEVDTPLTRCAEPVLRRLAERLDGRAISIILTDPAGLVLSRRTSDAAFEARLDRVLLAPGFSFAEQYVGTNGIGTALEVGAGTSVLGHEHYAENLEGFACAAAPIRDARTGRIAGAMNLTCTRGSADDLLLTLAESTAEQIEQALAATASRRELAVLDEYRRACRRDSSAVIAVSADALILNAAARNQLDTADQSALLSLTGDRGTVAADRSSAQRLLLPSGRAAHVRRRAVSVDSAVVGTVLRIAFERDHDNQLGLGAPRAPRSLPGVVGTSAVWRQVSAEVTAAYAAGRWLALAGEPGVGKTALLQAAVRTVGRRALVLDARTGDLPDLHRADPGSALIVRHADELDGAGLQRLDRLLDRLDPARAWLGLTIGPEPGGERLSGLLARVAKVVEVPPLRMHLDDVPLLTEHILRVLSHGQGPSCSPDAHRSLLHASWPGNIAQLRSVLLDTVQRHPGAVLAAADLPPEVHATSRRVLTPLEAMERDAIAKALADSGGDKRRAAAALGISRATVYRKIRQYGILRPS